MSWKKDYGSIEETSNCECMIFQYLRIMGGRKIGYDISSQLLFPPHYSIFTYHGDRVNFISFDTTNEGRV
jgi:hypothetical protein